VFFLKLSVDKKEVYQGEQVTVTYKFYNRATTGNVSVSEMPSYTGFWVQELEVPENVQFTPEVYEGVQYNVAVAKRDALFPSVLASLKFHRWNCKPPCGCAQVIRAVYG